MKVTCYISWNKIIEFGFTGVQTSQTIYLVYLKSLVFEKTQNFQRTKYVRHFWVFDLSYGANSRRQKLRKPHFSGKQISEMIFHESELILKTIKTICYNGLFGSFFGISILKVIHMAYLGRVFEILRVKFKFFKNLKISGVSLFSFRTTELKFMW